MSFHDLDLEATRERLIRPGLAAKRLGVSTETIRRWMRNGALAYVEVGPYHRKRLKESDVERQRAEMR